MASEVTSLGAHTDLWRPSEGDLSSMVDRFGWRRLFPPMRKAWNTLGTVKPEVAAATGLSSDVRIICGAHDFERLACAASPVSARAVHRDLDRHLGHHHGRGRNGAARSRSRHAGQCRRARRAGADSALHGRARIWRFLRATCRPTRTKQTSAPSSLLACSPCPRSPTRAARSLRVKVVIGGHPPDGAKSARGARDPLLGVDDRAYAPAPRSAGRPYRRRRFRPLAGLRRRARQAHGRPAGCDRAGERRRCSRRRDARPLGCAPSAAGARAGICLGPART